MRNYSGSKEREKPSTPSMFYFSPWQRLNCARKRRLQGSGTRSSAKSSGAGSCETRCAYYLRRYIQRTWRKATRSVRRMPQMRAAIKGKRPNDGGWPLNFFLLTAQVREKGALGMDVRLGCRGMRAP